MNKKTTLNSGRLQELHDNKVKVLDVVFAASVARAEVSDFMRIKLGLEPKLKRNELMYYAGMKKMLEDASNVEETKEIELIALANLAQASFLSGLAMVLGVEAEEMELISEMVAQTESKMESKEGVEELKDMISEMAPNSKEKKRIMDKLDKLERMH